MIDERTEERKKMIEFPKKFTTTLRFAPSMQFSPELRHFKKLRDKGNKIPIDVIGVTRIKGEKLLFWFTPLFQPRIESCILAEHLDIKVDQIPPESLRVIPFFNK